MSCRAQGTQRANLGSERADFRPGRVDFGPHRSVLGSERADVGRERGLSGLRGDGRTDRWTDGRLEKHPCVLQDIGPTGPLPKKGTDGPAVRRTVRLADQLKLHSKRLKIELYTNRKQKKS